MTLKSAPILSTEISSRLSALDSDSAMTSAPAASANGNTGKFAARQLDEKGWPSEAKVEISNLLRPSFPVRARFWPKPNTSSGSEMPGPISRTELRLRSVCRAIYLMEGEFKQTTEKSHRT